MKINKKELTQLIKETLKEGRWDSTLYGGEYGSGGRRNKELYGGEPGVRHARYSPEEIEALTSNKPEEVEVEEPTVSLNKMIDDVVNLLEDADRETLNGYLLEIEKIQDKDSPAFKIADAVYDVILDLGESAGYVD